MTKPKKKLIATFRGTIAEAFENDRVEISGTYRKGVYELYLTMDKRKEMTNFFGNEWTNYKK